MPLSEDQKASLRTDLERTKHQRLIDHFELWAARKLKVDVHAGDTRPIDRRERVRTLILDRHLAGVPVIGPEADAGVETWTSLFERIYGMDLITQGRVEHGDESQDEEHEAA